MVVMVMAIIVIGVICIGIGHVVVHAVIIVVVIVGSGGSIWAVMGLARLRLLGLLRVGRGRVETA